MQEKNLIRTLTLNPSLNFIGDADLGLTNFQIMMIVGEGENGPNGIEYEAFIANVHHPTLLSSLSRV